ncbi:MAG TPA: hypothetical protein VGB73_13475 [Pyrinomonadaceae bacterium]|jgi:hypothetical protein
MKSLEQESERLPSVRACFEEESALVRSRGYWNCLNAARKLSALLLKAGHEPWIARLRKTESFNGGVFHAPLTPRVAGVAATWTTHYLCCCDGTAYDPVAGRPLQLESYSLEVFGQQIALEVFVPRAQLAAYLAGRWSP